jgi:hypothetical protein
MGLRELVGRARVTVAVDVQTLTTARSVLTVSALPAQIVLTHARPVSKTRPGMRLTASALPIPTNMTL